CHDPSANAGATGTRAKGVDRAQYDERGHTQHGTNPPRRNAEPPDTRHERHARDREQHEVTRPWLGTGVAPVAHLPLPEADVLLPQRPEVGPRDVADVDARLEPHGRAATHPLVQVEVLVRRERFVPATDGTHLLGAEEAEVHRIAGAAR